MPDHLRWELYPVAHETERPYGGSYFEKLDWWKTSREKSLLGELRFMGSELFLFKLYYRLNKNYWYYVYPFHIGTFLLVAWLVLLLLGAITSIAGVEVSSGSANAWGIIIHYLTLITGIGGYIIAGFGCLGLLIKRFRNESLKRYTVPVDYFNLTFIMVVIIAGLVSWILFDPVFSIARDFMISLISFTPASSINPATYTSILLISLFLMYSPFTRMTHYVAKFFTYHKVLWDDSPNIAGNSVYGKENHLLNQIPCWSGDHIQAGKSWKAVSANLPEDTGKESK